MRQDLVLTFLGLDRPGLVELVSKTVAAHEGNWEGSRMARMAGRFAGILKVSVPAERVDPLSADLVALAGKGLQVVVERSAPAETPGLDRWLRLELVGTDRAGVVRDVSAVLVASGINVEELTSDTSSAPMAGGTVLKVVARLRASSAVDLGALQRQLEERTPDFIVDLEAQAEAR